MAPDLAPVFRLAIQQQAPRDVAQMFLHYMSKNLAGGLFVMGVEDAAGKTFEFSREKIDYWINLHRKKHGENPAKDSGIVSKHSDITWGDVNIALLMGFGDLPGGSSLEHVLYENKFQKTRPRISEALVLYNALKHYEYSHEIIGKQKLPTQRSGKILDLDYETWISWQNAAQGGRKGLKPVGGLNGVFIKFGLKLGNLDKQLIKNLILEHYKIHGELPTKSSGKVLDYLGETWAAIDQALYAGERCLEKQAGLNSLYIEFGFKLGDLTEDVIIEHARAHLHKHGKLPTQYSKQVGEFIGENWAAWNAALKGGWRGLKEKTTLKQLFEKHGLVEEALALQRANEASNADYQEYSF